MKHNCIRFQKQIRVLNAKLERAEADSRSFVRALSALLLYGILRRGGPAIMAIPSLQATVSGSRPPTGSGLLQGYTTALLQHVPARKRSCSVVFSDGIIELGSEQRKPWECVASEQRMDQKRPLF